MDSYVFVATVLEPVLGGDNAAGGTFFTRVEATLAKHLPVSRRNFDLVLFHSECQALSRSELIDRFVSGDQLHVVAYPGSNGGASLEAPATWIRLRSESIPRGIDTPFEYFAALLELERLETDSERTTILRSMANFIEDPELYAQILDTHLERKSLRKQLRDVHAMLHPGSR